MAVKTKKRGKPFEVRILDMMRAEIDDLRVEVSDYKDNSAKRAAAALEELSSVGSQIRDLQSNCGKIWAEIRQIRQDLRLLARDEATTATRVLDNSTRLDNQGRGVKELSERLDKLNIPAILEEIKITLLERIRAHERRLEKLEPKEGPAPPDEPDRATEPVVRVHKINVDTGDVDPDRFVFGMIEALERAKAARQGGTVIELVVYPDGTFRLKDLPKDTRPGRYWARLGILGRSTR